MLFTFNTRPHFHVSVPQFPSPSPSPGTILMLHFGLYSGKLALFCRSCGVWKMQILISLLCIIFRPWPKNATPRSTIIIQFIIYEKQLFLTHFEIYNRSLLPLTHYLPFERAQKFVLNGSKFLIEMAELACSTMNCARGDRSKCEQWKIYLNVQPGCRSKRQPWLYLPSNHKPLCNPFNLSVCGTCQTLSNPPTPIRLPSHPAP